MNRFVLDYYDLLNVFSLCVSAVEVLLPPQNPTMVTLNTNYALKWDWDQSAAEGHEVTFTTQYTS